MHAAKGNDALVQGTLRWRPFVIGVVVSVITALPTSLLLFGTESEFASEVLAVVYAAPVLLYLLFGDPGVTNVFLAFVMGQFAVYGAIVSMFERARSRKLVGWLLLGLHLITAVLALAVRASKIGS
jgi:hypothetical protein